MAPHKTVLFSGITTVVSVCIVVLRHYCGLRRILYKWHTEHKSLKNPQSHHSIQKFWLVAKKGSVTDELEWFLDGKNGSYCSFCHFFGRQYSDDVKFLFDQRNDFF